MPHRRSHRRSSASRSTVTIAFNSSTELSSLTTRVTSSRVTATTSRPRVRPSTVSSSRISVAPSSRHIPTATNHRVVVISRSCRVINTRRRSSESARHRRRVRRMPRRRRPRCRGIRWRSGSSGLSRSSRMCDTNSRAYSMITSSITAWRDTRWSWQHGRGVEGRFIRTTGTLPLALLSEPGRLSASYSLITCFIVYRLVQDQIQSQIGVPWAAAQPRTSD